VGEGVPTFLTSALDGSEQSTSRPCHFTSGKAASGTHCVESWVGFREKFIVPAGNHNLTLHPLQYRLSYHGSLSFFKDTEKVEIVCFRARENSVRKESTRSTVWQLVKQFEETAVN
jgi:hypothetical protein